MTSVIEVYDCDASADESAAVEVLKAAGVADRDARGMLGSLFWHKRPFTVVPSSAMSVAELADRLRLCGYHSRPGQDDARRRPS